MTFDRIKDSCLICLGLLIGGCNGTDNNLYLNKVQLGKSDEIDTLESDLNRGLYVIQIIHNGALGHFSTNYGVLKKNKVGGDVVYEMVNDEKTGKRISKDFIATVASYGETNWGWLYVRNGKISTQLPNMSRILDRLESEKIEKDLIKETNGYIGFYLNGMVVKELNYGDFVTKYNSLNYDSLDYKLYKLEDDSLKIVSENGNDIFKQKQGVFFVPLPGYGVLHKYNKKQILNLVDSVSKLKSSPETIKIKEVH